MDRAAADTELTEALRERGRRVTPQRVLMYRALMHLGTHATAEDVLRRSAGQLPRLSLPTVYAALDLFVELGLARRVDAGTGTVLFDPRTDEHQHFACRSCGRVVDVDAKLDLAPAERAARAGGLRVEAAQVVLAGQCERCAA